MCATDCNQHFGTKGGVRKGLSQGHKKMARSGCRKEEGLTDDNHRQRSFIYLFFRFR